MNILFLPLSLAYCELINIYLSGINASYFAAFCCAITAGLLLNFICFILKHNKWILFLLCEAAALFFCIEFFTNANYSVYMSPLAIITGASGVATEFGDAVKDVIVGGALQILLFHVPVFIALICNIRGNKLEINREDSLVAVMLVAAVFFGSIGHDAQINLNEPAYTYLYSYDNAVKNFGVCTAVKLDAKYAYTGVPAAPVIAHEIEEEPKEETKTIQDEYTALFKGKNLVLIAAESLSKEEIREDINPCLYRMATRGIIVEDYYQPFWGGSTTSGEASVLLGRIPTENTESMNCIVDKDNSALLAGSFKKEGYYTLALHPGEYDYYDRYITHIAYGFDDFLARGNGLDIQYTWPGDDLAAIEAASEKFIHDDPFFLYFMSYSGHGLYNFKGNIMSVKNQDYINSLSLDNSETVLAYHAANHQFDRSLQYLCDTLEAAGKLDDTVFVITADHYPYALQKGDAWKNEEDYLSELYGYSYANEMQRDHSALIIWTPSLEDRETPITVSGPCYSVDIVPTIYNLFGIEYNLEWFVGRDILSDTEALAIWISGSWKNDLGFYDASRNTFTPASEGVTINDAGLNRIRAEVAGKIEFSRYLSHNDFYGSMLGK